MHVRLDVNVHPEQDLDLLAELLDELHELDGVEHGVYVHDALPLDREPHLPFLLPVPIEEDPGPWEAEVEGEANLEAGDGDDAQALLQDELQDLRVGVGLHGEADEVLAVAEAVLVSADVLDELLLAVDVDGGGNAVLRLGDEIGQLGELDRFAEKGAILVRKAIALVHSFNQC